MAAREGGNSGSDSSLPSPEICGRSPSGIGFPSACEAGTSVIGGLNFRFRDTDGCDDEDEFGVDEAGGAAG